MDERGWIVVPSIKRWKGPTETSIISSSSWSSYPRCFKSLKNKGETCKKALKKFTNVVYLIRMNLSSNQSFTKCLWIKYRAVHHPTSKINPTLQIWRHYRRTNLKQVIVKCKSSHSYQKLLLKVQLTSGELAQTAESMTQKSNSGEIIHNGTRQCITLNQTDRARINSTLLQTQVNNHCNQITKSNVKPPVADTVP